MSSLEMASKQTLECVPSRDKKENDHKVFPRDRFNSYRVFHFDDSESNEDEKSREVLECVSRSSVSETGESLQIPSSNPNPTSSSSLEILKASSLVQIWEARSQQPSLSPTQFLINTEFLNDKASKNEESSCDEISHVSDSEKVSKTILRDRENELEQLVDPNAVSKFSPRGSGHLQYMLTTRSFESCIEIQERTCDVNRSLQESSVMNFRDKYKTNTEKGSAVNVNSAAEAQNSSGLVSSQVNKVCKMANQTEDKNVLQEITEKSIPSKIQDATYKPKIAKKPVLTVDAGNKNSFKKPRTEENSTEEREGLRKYIVKESEETNKSSMSFAEMVNLWDSMLETAKNEGKVPRIITDEETIERKKEEVSSFEEGKSMEIEAYRINPETVTLAICWDRRKEEETGSHNSRKNGKEKKYSQEDGETLLAKNEEASGMILKTIEDEDFCGESVQNDWISNLLKPQSHWKELRKQREFEITKKSSEKDDIQNLLKRRPVSSCLASDFRKTIDEILISSARKRSKVESILVEEEEKENEEDEDEEAEESLVECSTRCQKKLKEEDETVKIDLENPENHENSSSVSDLREQIKQLQREMLELKSLVNSCVDFKKSKSLNDSLDRNCSVCFQMPVVSLLYRCGHMYTCLKCASMGK